MISKIDIPQTDPTETKRKTVVVIDTQPVSIEGVRTLLARTPDLIFAGSMNDISCGMPYVNSLQPDVALVDKSFGMQALLDWLPILRASHTAAVIWGTAINNAEALRLVQGGARGVVQRTSHLEGLLACLRTAAEGGTWTSDTILQVADHETRIRSSLTFREQQVAELVEQGLRNKDIANSLGIQTGTVKIHLKHIFEKTGCRGRYGLALSGLREKGFLSQAVM